MMMNSAQIVIGLGEVLWDCFPTERHPGGAPANVAFHAQQLGATGAVCSRVGEDPLGGELLEYLTSNGLSTDYIQRDAEHETGRVTVDTSDPERPNYVIHEDVAWDHMVFTPEWKSLAERAAAVCFGTLAQRHEVSRATIQSCLKAAPNALRIYDINLRQAYFTREIIEDSLRLANIAKLNIDEVAVLAELLESKSAAPDDCAAMLRDQYGVDILLVTRAERGCLLYSADESVEQAGIEVEVADAVGAGDAFTAALIASRLDRWPLEASARFANAVGALVASHHGAMPPLKDEFAKLAQEHGPR